MEFGGKTCLNILYKSYHIKKLSGIKWGHEAPKKGKIFKFVRFQKLRCHIIHLEAAVKSCHCDPNVRPFLGGQRSRERSISQLYPISKIKVSNCWS